MKKFIIITVSAIFLTGCTGPTIDECKERGDVVGKIVNSIIDNPEEWREVPNDAVAKDRFEHKNGLMFYFIKSSSSVNPGETLDPDWDFHPYHPSRKQWCIHKAYKAWKTKTVLELKF